MPPNFTMPTFERTKTLDGNYAKILLALGLLSEDVPGVTMKMAEQELAKCMPSFDVGPYSIKVEEGKYKSAAFFLALARQKGESQFVLEPEDIFAFCNYLTDEVIEDANKHPGKHQTIDYIRKAFGQINVNVNITVA